MATVSVVACDQCKKTPATTWSIQQSGQPGHLVDLCTDCAKPLRVFVKAGRPETAGTGRRRVGVKKSMTYPD